MNNTNQTDSRKWSDQQEAIFAEFRDGRNNVVIRARAGTGKTTTILRAIDFAPESRILLAAFNKKIAEELKTKLTNTKAEAKTLHGVGFALVMRNWRGVKLDNDRGNRLAKAAADKIALRLGSNQQANGEAIRLTAQLASKAKGALPFPTLTGLVELADQFELIPSEELAEDGWTTQDIAAAAGNAMHLATKADGTVDFDDMVFVPVANRWVRGQYDLVVIDEAQDMNASQLLLAQGVCKASGRVVVVGDDRQAIYGFRGADAGSLDRLKAELKAVELGLTITYRCPSSVVARAQAIVPDYQAAPTAPAGEVIDLDYSKVVEMANQGDFILSRKNAPLARVCLALLRAGKRARIEGRDIGATFVKIVRDLKAKSIPDFLARLSKWESKQKARATAAATKNTEAKLEQLSDQAETLRALADGMLSITELTARIESLFTETAGGKKDFTICSTVHRSKGLETDTVFVLTETLYPGGRHDTEEQNIEYVAITRAKNRLVLVTGMESKKEE